MCQHHSFAADVTVNRLEDTGRFAADVRIQCVECGTPFRFLGLPIGLDLTGATVSSDGTEARLAVAPGEWVELVGPVGGVCGGSTPETPPPPAGDRGRGGRAGPAEGVPGS